MPAGWKSGNCGNLFFEEYPHNDSYHHRIDKENGRSNSGIHVIIAHKQSSDEKRIVMENMLAFKRAGAKIIITYHALDVAKWIKEM